MLLVIAVGVVYYPVFSNQFQLGWDDQVMVINGYTGGGLRLHNLWAIFTQVYAGQYAPVNQFIYSILYTLFGYDPFWFHLFSFLIHTVNVLLVFSFIKRLLTETKIFNIRSKYRIAFVTALLMAIHPFLVESVAWISASKVLIYGLFYLAAMHFYLDYLKSKKIIYYVLIIMMFTLSFGAKEQAITLPICFLLIDYTLKRNLKDPKIWIEKLPLFVLLFVFGYITLLSHSLKYAPISAQAPTYPFYQNVIFACYAISEYWIKCFVPFTLQYMYLYPNAIDQQLPLMFWVYPVALGLIIISFASFWKKRWIFFGLMFFLIHIVLVLNMVPMARFAVMAGELLISYNVNSTEFLKDLSKDPNLYRPRFIKLKFN